jgi:hypothetical protein
MQASHTMRRVELGVGIVGWLCMIVTVLLISVLIDHWLWPFHFLARLAVFCFLIGWSVWWIPRRVLPPLMQPIHPEHTARRIESQFPQLKESLISWLQLSTENAAPRGVLAVVGRFAVRNLGGNDSSNIIDSANLIRLAALLFSFLMTGAVYFGVSPKSGVTSLARMLMPWANIAPAARVQIVDVSPGNATITQGSSLSLGVTVRGMHQGDNVRIRYDLSDGQLVGQKLNMQTEIEGINYRLEFGETFGGIHQPLNYWVEAGDAVAGPFAVKVQVVPIVAIDRIEYEFPAYTRLRNTTKKNEGSIEAPEGTRVQVFAHANQRMSKSRIEFDPIVDQRVTKGASRLLELTTDETKIQGSWILQLDDQKSNPTHSSYRIKAFNALGESNSDPLIYKIKVIGDYAPEVHLQSDLPALIQVPMQGSQEIEMRAFDPDFGLTSLTYAISKGKDIVAEETLFESKEGVTNQLVRTFVFRPEDFHLNVGDQVELRAIAKDNRCKVGSDTPEPNVSRTPPLTIRIIDGSNSAENNKNTLPNGSDPKKPSPPNASRTPDGNQSNKTPQKNQPPSTNPDQNKGPSSKSDSPNSEPPKNGKPDKNQTNDDKQNNQDGQGNKKQESQNGSGGGQSNSEPSQGKQNSQSNGSGSSESSESESNDASSDGQGGKSNSKNSKNGKSTSTDSSNNASDSADNNSDTNQGSESSSGRSKGARNSSPSSSGVNGDTTSDPEDLISEPSHDGQTFEKLDQLRREKESKTSKGEPSGQSRTSSEQTTDQQPSDAAGDGGNAEVKNPSSGSNRKTPDGSTDPSSSSDTSRNNQQGEKKDAGNANDAAKAGEPNANPSAQKPNPSSAKNSNSSNAQPNADASADKGKPNNNSPADNAKTTEQSPKSDSTQSSNQNSHENTGASENKSNDSGSNASDSTPGTSTKDASKKPNDSGSEKSDQQPQNAKSSKDPSDSKGGTQNADSDKSAPKSASSDGSSSNNSQTKDSNSNASQSSKNGTDNKSSNSPKPDNKASDSKSSDNNADSKQQGGDESAANSDNSSKSGAGEAANEKNSTNPSQQKGNDASKASDPTRGGDPKSGNNPQGKKPEAGSNSKESSPGSSASADKGQSQGGGGKSPAKDGDASKPSKDQSGKGSAGQNQNGGYGMGGGQSSGAENKSSGPDPTNEEYAKQVTDLALDYLKQQRDQPDPELLRKMNWTKEDMQKFVDRWTQAKELAKSDPNKKREFDASLRSLGLRPGKSRERQVDDRDDQMKGLLEEGTRVRPPESLREQFEQFRRAAGKL